MKRGVLAAIGLVAILALAGCAGASAVPPSAPTTESAPAETQAEIASPIPTQPTLADLVVSPDGLGPLQLNQPVPAQSGATAVVTWDATACSADGRSTYRGAWLANYPRTGEVEISNQKGAVFTFESETQESPITFIAIWSPELKTAQGIGIGSTASQIESAYGSAVAMQHGQLSDLYSIEGTTGTLVIEVPTAVDPNFRQWSESDLGKVVWMFLLAGHADDGAFSLEGNQQAGSCFVFE